MSEAALGGSLAGRRSASYAEAGLAVLICIALVLKLHLVFVINVNWDEFFQLSHVHAYLRDALGIQLQTFTVHLFAWVPLISGNEVDQVIAARLLIYALTLGSCLLTYAIARLYLSKAASLFAVLCYLAFSYGVEHGISYRADPLCAFLFLIAVYLILARPGSRLAAVAAGLAQALALMISIKALLYLPVLGVLFLSRLLPSQARWTAVKDIAVFSLSLLVSFALLYSLHRASLAPPDALNPTGYVGQTASKMMLPDQFFPRFYFFLKSVVANPLVWACILAGTVVTAVAGLSAKPGHRAEKLVLLSFAIPLLYLAFYRNAFPYFYVTFLSPLVVLCGVAFDRLLKLDRAERSPATKVLAAVLSVAVFGSFLFHYARNAPDRTVAQRELVQVVHEVFPDPAPYIDRCGMLSSFTKVGFFMSSWGMENYLAAGRPVMRDLIVEEQPLFLIANTHSLDLSIDPESRPEGGYWLLPEDFETLRANFIPHWGRLYVAGKHLRSEGSGQPTEFEILIAGTYTVESHAEVEIDGVPYRPDSYIELQAGPHRLVAPGAVEVVLRWGQDLPRPSGLPSTDPIFVGF